MQVKADKPNSEGDPDWTHPGRIVAVQALQAEIERCNASIAEAGAKGTSADEVATMQASLVTLQGKCDMIQQLFALERVTPQEFIGVLEHGAKRDRALLMHFTSRGPKPEALAAVAGIEARLKITLEEIGAIKESLGL